MGSLYCVTLDLSVGVVGVVCTKQDSPYFKVKTELGFTQFDVDRMLIRHSKGDYPKGFISHVFSLNDSINEDEFVNVRLEAAISNFDKHNLFKGQF